MTEGGARLEAAFREAGRPIYMPYVMGGDPDIAASARRARLLARHADVLEIGIPFSDPLADGPTIQAAGQRALAAGTRVHEVIELAEELRGGPPIALMTYVNVIMAAGERAFCERAARAGVAGLIVPDLPIDEGETLRAHARRAGVAIIPLAAPTTTDERLTLIGRRGEGFLYCVSVTGVTGGEVRVGADLRDFLARARATVDLPLAVGFGVRTPAHAAAIGEIADGVVIASELIRLAEAAGSLEAAEEAIEAFGQGILGALAALGRAPAGGSQPKR
jgi:tryptophan synthase alpha chain